MGITGNTITPWPWPIVTVDAKAVHETNSEMAVSLEAHIDAGHFTNPRDCFFWMLGYAFDRETGTRIMDKLHAAEEKAGGAK